jgi:spore germination protein
MRKWLLASLLPFVMILSSCATQFEIPSLEDLGMVGVMAFDYVDEKKMKITVSVPQPSEDATEKTQFYSTEVAMVHQAIVALSAQSERTLSTAQLRVILFGEELARKEGVKDIIKHLYRDPAVGDNVFIAITKGSAEELMKAKYPDKPQINQFLNDLLHPRESTAFNPFTTVHDFIYDLTNEVSDPLAPYLEQKEKTVEISKIALFNHEKMVGTISPEEAKIVQGLQNVVQIPSFLSIIHQAEEEKNKEKRNKEENKPTRILIDFVKTKFKVTSNGDLNEPELDIKIYLRGSIVEYTGDKTNFENSETLNSIQTVVEKELEKNLEKLLKKFKDLSIDPIALSESLRRKYRGEWSKEKGLRALKKAKVNYHTELEIISTGTIR